MQKLFVIMAGEPEDIGVYEQVFEEAGFRLVFGTDEDDLLLCSGALLYGSADARQDDVCASLTAFCQRRSIPLLIMHDSSLYPELKEAPGVYDASAITMREWIDALTPKEAEKEETPPALRRFLNLLMILFCTVPLVLFSIRIWDASRSAETVQTEEADNTILETCGISAAQVYAISSFGDTVYRGSGFAVSEDGYILTCAHVVDHPSAMYRIVYHLQVLPAELIARDPERDLALLKISTATRPLALAESEPEKGNPIWLIGWPEDSPRTLLAGTYDGRTADTGANLFKVISLPMYQGVSGSCIINEKGEAVGMAAAMDSSDHTVGLIVPLSDCRSFLKDHIFAQD